jgi:glycosyltransferase involved in cell wall biosynthesis
VYYPPSETSAAQMMRDLALEFTSLGHEVIVATLSEDILSPTTVDDEENVTVLRIRSGRLKGTNHVIRMWRESRISATMWRRGRHFFEANPCDLIVFYSPTIFFGDLVRRLKSLWRCPSYLILRDIFPQWAVDAGLLRKGLLFKYLKRREFAQYAASSVIGIEAPGNREYFEKDARLSRYRIEILHNWVALNSRPKGVSQWRKRLELEDKVVFFYGGNIGKVQDMENILQLAASMRDHKEMFFLLVGSGSEELHVKEIIVERKMRNIRLLSTLPQRDYFECLSEFDVGLISLDRRLSSHNFTGKLLGYVMCGKPILASVNPGNDLIAFLQREDAGIACVNGENEKLEEAALFLASDPQARERMGRKARALGETTFSAHVAACKILSHFATPQVLNRDQK